MTDYFGNGEVGLPTFFVVNREGRIVNKHMGYAPQVIEKSLKKIL